MIKTRKDAADYLRNIADNATTANHQAALRMAIEALEQVEALEEIVMKQGEMNLRLIEKELERDENTGGV